jgi:hypothetical protein
MALRDAAKNTHTDSAASGFVAGALAIWIITDSGAVVGRTLAGCAVQVSPGGAVQANVTGCWKLPTGTTDRIAEACCAAFNWMEAAGWLLLPNWS